MRTIICKKCGKEIDATLGECPYCGTVYYILPEEDKKLEWAMSTDSDVDDTKIMRSIDENQPQNPAHTPRDIFGADNDELFNTRVWRLNEEQEAKEPVRPQQERPIAPPPVRRPAQQPRPVRPNPAQEAAKPAPGKAQPPVKDKEKELRKKQLIVAAVALLAVLTLVLSIMGGLFNFGGGKDEQKMQNLVGMREETAQNILDAMGLDVKIEQKADSEPEGTVIGQSIEENKVVKKGDKITITVSNGQAPETSDNGDYIEVPGLTDKTYDEATQTLDQLGLSISRNEDVFNDKDSGIVVSQEPMKGAKLKKGDTVKVTVSKGPEPSPSPEAHTISVTAGKGGTISPKGAVSVADGEDQTFTITPDSGYEISEVKVDGTSIGASTTYTFTKVTGEHTIYAVFRQKSATSSPTPSPTPSGNPSSGTDIQ